jgi:acetyl-CoA carboxylase biotin carboxyl carrier protein
MTTNKETKVDRTLDGLTDAEVRQISQLIETLDSSSLDFLEVDAGGIKVTISKSGAGLNQRQQPNAAPAPVPALAAAAPTPPPPAVVSAQPVARPAPDSAAQDGTVAITAPLMGRFYPQPEPGAPPFVTVGSEVAEDTVVGLIEVMKLFNTVQAGVRGTITEICAPAGEFLEYGTVLFRVRPSAGQGA